MTCDKTGAGDGVENDSIITYKRMQTKTTVDWLIDWVREKKQGITSTG